jgi:2-polyprenyl-6-methoxyphenol hydroxylase-like FAD-dependent oxidoreductase
LLKKFKLRERKKNMKVVIVGGGLVGSLAACSFAQRGEEVEVYELRKGTNTACVSSTSLTFNQPQRCP